MKPATIATLQELDAVEWFVKVGCRDTDVAEVLGSWDGAIEHCTSDEWKDLTLEAANQYRERLMERSPQRLAVTVHGPTRRWRASRAEGEAEVMAQGRWCGVRESRA